MTNKKGQNQIRIIGGQWRGRLIDFSEETGLRPTSNRVRETLFNWLQGKVEGARCLDLFAGSGALGLEALSRGAAEVVWVEQNSVVARTLRTQLDKLGVIGGQVVQTDALAYLRNTLQPFDLIFLDPPFHQDWISRCCPLLVERGWLASETLIYLEAEATLFPLPLPAEWTLLRTRRAGAVGYHLVRTVCCAV